MSLTWQSEEVFFDGDSYFRRLIEDIDQASQYISIEIYIFNDDVIGRLIADHLFKAYERGVKVQIIVDGVGSYGFFDRMNGLFRDKKIFVKMYNPLPFYHPYYGKLTLLRKAQALGVRLLRINNRNHRKIITIDYNIMYSGSYNITAEHTRFHKEKPWKDMGVRVTGEIVKYSVLNFKKMWKLRDYFRYKKTLKNRADFNWKTSPLRLNQTVFMKNFFYRDFIRRTQQAERRIWFMTPYFIPKRRLIRALGKAAKRGVDVRILISQRTDVKFFHWLQYFYYGYLLNNGVKVYQYTESVLHAKNYLIDDYISIGSTNLNHRSFLHDLEVDLVIKDEDNKCKVEDHFVASINPPNMVTLEKMAQRSFLERFLSRLFFLFKYWF